MAALSLVQVESVNRLQRATHIKWFRTLTYYHHAIVEEVYPEKGTIKVIQYAPDEDTEEKHKGKIHEKTLNPFEGNQPLFLVRYKKDSEDEDSAEVDSADEVIARAHSRIGENKYNLLTNNCEHFATWCKTGKKMSWQLISVGINALKQIAFSVMRGAFRALTGIIRSIIDEIALTTAKAINKVFTGGLKSANKISALGAVGSYASIALIVVIEGGLTIKDIYDLHKSKNRKELSNKEFTNQTVIRSTEGICTVLGAVLGALAGAFIPVPIIGEIIGSFIGGLIGKGIGRLCGKGVMGFVELVQQEMDEKEWIKKLNQRKDETDSNQISPYLN